MITRFTFIVEAVHDGDPEDIAAIVGARLPRLFRDEAAELLSWSAGHEPIGEQP